MPKTEKEEILHFLRVVSGNRITLPEDVRRILEIEVGDYVRVEIVPQDRKVILAPAA